MCHESVMGGYTIWLCKISFALGQQALMIQAETALMMLLMATPARISVVRDAPEMEATA